MKEFWKTEDEHFCEALLPNVLPHLRREESMREQSFGERMCKFLEAPRQEEPTDEDE